MSTDPVVPQLRPAEPQPLTSHKLRISIRLYVVAIHCVLIFGPLGYLLFYSWLSPQESAFKVKLMGPLSTGEVVGPPSRLRPSDNPGPPPPAPEPPAPEPPAPEPPAPEPPAPEPPRPTPPPVPRQTAKPKPKQPPVPKQTAKPKPTSSKPTPPKHTAQKPAPAKPAPPAPRKLTAEEQVALARKAATKYGDGGGSNTNIAVPIGNADRAQAYGKQNNGTPGGGAKGEDEAYWTRLGDYVKMRWTQPPGSLLGETRPTVTIELEIAADGRVTGSRIVHRSGNHSMDDSVQRLLAILDRVPAPSNGATSIQIQLETKD